MLERLDSVLSGDARAWLDRARAQGAEGLAAALPGLARRAGRGVYGGGRASRDVGEGRPAIVDLDALRVCDAAGIALLDAVAPTDAQWVDLYLAGDMEERTILLRAANARPVTAATVRLLEEVQRSNVESHFAAGVCDSNLAIRALERGAIDAATFNRLLLKVAFLGLPLARVFDAGDAANPELSRMLQDLATEREAAGRGVWADTCRMIARAPTAGTVARVIGGLEHGDDRLRLAAAEAARLLARADVRELVAERLPREPRAEIRAALERAQND